MNDTTRELLHFPLHEMLQGHGPAKVDLGAQELSAIQPDPEPVGYPSCACGLFSFNGAQRQELKRERENNTIHVCYVVLMLRRTEPVRTVRLKAVLRIHWRVEDARSGWASFAVMFSL